jgi:hypothetical protein
MCAIRCADSDQSGVPLAPLLIKQVDEVAGTLEIGTLAGRG